MRKFPEELKTKFRIFARLGSPAKIQSFLDRLPVNFEKKGETCRSPLRVLESGEAHCLEGAMLAAAALWYHGAPPLLLDLKTNPPDFDHVVAPFRQNGRWGAVSKTNHAVLRYRDPVYKSVRELAMSYFHEYFLDSGRKTMQSFSRPFDLSGEAGWLTSDEDLWRISRALDRSPHEAVAPKSVILRKASPIEIRAGKLKEWRGS